MCQNSADQNDIIIKALIKEPTKNNFTFSGTKNSSKKEKGRAVSVEFETFAHPIFFVHLYIVFVPKLL